jgi:AcrR family transcriptional regulator
MSRKPASPDTHSPAGGRTEQKLRTRRQLLASARRLLESGAQPTVTEVADDAKISRRTAYRYFPTQAKMLTEAALEGLRPAMETAIAGTERTPRAELPGVEERVDAMIVNMMRLAVQNEPLLRTMIHQTVLEPPNPQHPKRGTRRIDWIETALEPLRHQITRPAWARLVSALAVSVGIESLIILRDMRGLSVAQSIQVTQWMGRALLRDALADARGEGSSPKKR